MGRSNWYPPKLRESGRNGKVSYYNGLTLNVRNVHQLPPKGCGIFVWNKNQETISKNPSHTPLKNYSPPKTYATKGPVLHLLWPDYSNISPTYDFPEKNNPFQTATFWGPLIARFVRSRCLFDPTSWWCACKTTVLPLPVPVLCLICARLRLESDWSRKKQRATGCCKEREGEKRGRKTTGNKDWLAVSTQMQKISKIGSSPQVGVKVKKIWNHHPEECRDSCGWIMLNPYFITLILCFCFDFSAV